MPKMNTENYTPAAILFNKTIRDMRNHVEYEKFLCRLLMDNDDTRQMKRNTDEHQDSVHRFIYNNPEMENLTEYGKYHNQGESNYKPTESGVL